MKIPAPSCTETGDPPKGWGVLTKSEQSLKCKEVFYCNSRAVHFQDVSIGMTGFRCQETNRSDMLFNLNDLYEICHSRLRHRDARRNYQSLTGPRETMLQGP